MKLGSLFDGSGGFPLGGAMCGIEPVWASEIEPFPVSVTTARFPGMKHLGDVTKINGAEIEPVDVITFGSPCQDLSIAGKMAGIHNGKRSSLFFEAIRKIIVMCLEKSDDEVSEISKFNQDLGADDLDMYELAYKIEEELGVSIPDEDLCDDIEEDAEYSFKFQTVKELFDLCKKYKLNN
jgi:acyl carrier protein